MPNARPAAPLAAAQRAGAKKRRRPCTLPVLGSHAEVPCPSQMPPNLEVSARAPSAPVNGEQLWPNLGHRVDGARPRAAAAARAAAARPAARARAADDVCSRRGCWRSSSSRPRSARRSSSGGSGGGGGRRCRCFAAVDGGLGRGGIRSGLAAALGGLQRYALASTASRGRSCCCCCC